MNNKKHIQKKYKNLIWSVIFLLLVVFTIRMVISQSKGLSPQKLYETVAAANKWWLGAAVISAGLFVWFDGGAICPILKATGYPQKLRRGFLYSTSDIYFSAITPSATGGQPASAYFMMQDKIPGGVVTATLILNLMMYTISIVILGLVGICICPGAFFGFSALSKIFITIGFVALTILSLFFLLILRKGEWIFQIFARLMRFLASKNIIHHLDRKLERINKAQEDYENCVQIIGGKSHVLLKALMWNLLQRASQMLVPSYLYLALGGEANHAFMVFAKQCLVTIGFNFVPIPGGMGISDYLMLDGFTKIMERSMAFQLEFLSRSITFYICVTISGIITLVGYLIGVKKHDRSI